VNATMKCVANKKKREFTKQWDLLIETNKSWVSAAPLNSHFHFRYLTLRRQFFLFFHFFLCCLLSFPSSLFSIRVLWLFSLRSCFVLLLKFSHNVWCAKKRCRNIFGNGDRTIDGIYSSVMDFMEFIWMKFKNNLKSCWK